MNNTLSQEYLKEIGSRLREIQKRNNLRDIDMAQILGITAGAYRKIVYGESAISLGHLITIHKTFGVDYDMIIDGKMEESTEALLNRIQMNVAALKKRVGELPEKETDDHSE